jgi:lipopolysaccharide export system protein LptA
MRRFRPLLLLAIVAILGGVGIVYQAARKRQDSRIPASPKPLPQNLSASANDWSWSHTVGGRPVVEVHAGEFKQVKEPSTFELERVELRIFHKNGQGYDKVRSAKAQFDIGRGVLYSEGEVEITLGVPAEEAPAGRLVFIRTSGATFESKTGKAYTDRPAHFVFEQGEGNSVGAAYDPAYRELHLRSQAELVWRGGARPMRIEAGELIYKERDSAVLLGPWSRMSKGATAIEGGRSIVWLTEGAIRLVETEAARGTDRRAGREVEYAADRLYLSFAPSGEIQKIDAVTNARMVSTDGPSITTVAADRVEIEFDVSSGDSILRKAFAKGRGVVETKPRPAGGKPLPETRLLKSDFIEFAMRAGGRELEFITTHAPGTVEFLPNRPGQKRRTLEGKRLFFFYGPDNQIRSFRSDTASSRTESPPAAGKPADPPALTWSRELLADFDATGALARVQQLGEFRYQEGDRRGLADRAEFEPAGNLITLFGPARLWNASGSVSAGRISLDQARDEFTAEGNVLSVQAPDRKAQSSGILTGDALLQARSNRMATSQGNRFVRYEGNAVLWQGANRIRGDWVEIDRASRNLKARGSVATQLVEEQAKSPAYTTIEAAELLYTEEDKLAHYRGGAKLQRGALTVLATELRARIAEPGSASRIERADADGNVRISQPGPDRERKGSADHAEYYAGEEKMVLSGGEPTFTDSVKGSTSGRKLTWFANNDRLLVEGGGDRPAVSRLHRK